MFGKFQSLVDEILGGGAPRDLGRDEVRIACAALLVHCAKADGHQSEEETAKLRQILRERYGLSEQDTGKLIDDAAAHESQAHDIHKFTWVLHRQLNRDERIDVVRALWDICHADGNIDHEERSVVNLAAGLLDVEMTDVVATRQSVERRRI